MPINRHVVGDQVGQTLEVQVEITAPDCTPGDKYKLTIPGVTLATAEQEIPVGATSHTFTWKSTAVLAAGLASPLAAELHKTHGTGASLAPVSTFQITVRPAPAAPAGPPPAPGAPGAGTPPVATAPVQVQVAGPIQVQVTGAGGSGSASRWINGAGTMGWLGALVIVLIIGLLFWIVTQVITPAALNGLSGGTSTIPAGQSTVVTEVKQTTISSDPAVLKEAAEASANISH